MDIPAWMATWDWGDVPAWLGVVLAIALPLGAYLKRNRIAGFFRRKATEPLPGVAPARFVVRPTQTTGLWAVVNTSASTAYNVTISGVTSGADVFDSGFWPLFMGKCIGTTQLGISPLARSYMQATEFRIDWEDENSDAHSTTFEIDIPSSNAKLLPVTAQEEGKVFHMAEMVEAARAQDEGE